MSVTIIQSGEPLQSQKGVPSILIAGHDGEWKDVLCKRLCNLPYDVIVVNTKTGKDTRWMIDAADGADVILFNSTTTLDDSDPVLIGMYAGSGKMLMRCHASFWRRDTAASVVARAKRVPQFETFDSLVSAAVERITELSTHVDVFDQVEDASFKDGLPKRLYGALKPFINAQNAVAVAETIRDVFEGEE